MLKIVLYIGDTPKGLIHKSIPGRATAIQIDTVLDNIKIAAEKQGFSIKNVEITEFKEL